MPASACQLPANDVRVATPESVRTATRMRRIRRVHFVGVGGAGMCGIAEIVLTQGYQVSGSDHHDSDVLARLRTLGATVFVGHVASQVSGADAVVVSTAIPESNVEVVEAHQRRIPVVPRAEMLGELMRYRHGVAVAGTHGKTTTTCMITEIFRAAGKDPTFVVGGLVKSASANARLGAGNDIIVEADESDASFLYLQPMTAVITNIDQDHLGTYGGDFEQLKSAFIEFTHRLPFYGVVVLCIDDKETRGVMARMTRPLLTYGFASDADYQAVDIAVDGMRTRFRALRPDGQPELDITLNLPGRHNVQNALAAIAVASDEGLSDNAICAGLAAYAGVGRRFDVTSDVQVGAAKVVLVDDYGHHPTEVRAVIATLRAVWPTRRVVMIYQLHRFSRTRDLFDDFVAVLSTVDVLVLLDVYPAGERAIAGADARSLGAAIQARGGITPLFCGDLDAVPGLLASIARESDVIVTQGAGNVSAISQRLREKN